MTLTEDSRGRVADFERVEDFRDRYDDFGRVEERRELPPDGYEAHRRRIGAAVNGGAGVWLTNDGGSVLLVRDAGDDGWVDPGGKPASPSRRPHGVRHARKPASTPGTGRRVAPSRPYSGLIIDATGRRRASFRR
jgi:hypothetical protein